MPMFFWPYRAAIAPYQDDCHKAAGVACEYEGGRSGNVSDNVSFLVEKTDTRVCVMVKGLPKTEQEFRFATLTESINEAAYN
jgi:hypothetical protein